MKSLSIKRFDSELPMPAYQTERAAAFDLMARLSMTIESLSIAYIPLNVAMKLPEGHAALLFARSSLHKRGLTLANGVGLLDEDYSGNEDEYKAAVYNFTNQTVKIERGDRIVQILVVPAIQFELLSVDTLEGPNRGAFGTTGK